MHPHYPREVFGLPLHPHTRSYRKSLVYQVGTMVSVWITVEIMVRVKVRVRRKVLFVIILF